MAKKARTELQEARRFGVILPVLLAALGAFSLFRDHPIRAYVLFGVSAAAGLLALLAPSLWLRFFRVWMKLALAMSWVMTRVLLSLFFYVVLTPTGLVLKLLGKAPLDLAWRDGKTSYWVPRDEVVSSMERYRKQY